MKIGKIIVNFLKKVLPFSEESMALISDDFEIKEELMNLHSDIMMKNHFKEKDNAPEFWIE